MSVFLHHSIPESYITHTYEKKKTTLAYSLQDFG